MWGCHNRGTASGCGVKTHFNRLVEVDSTVVDTWENMSVDIDHGW
jgi:hypothetical protein